MTLNNPTSPNINETISEMVGNINENLVQLDGRTTASGYSIQYVDWDVAWSDGYSYIAGVGFEPRVIVLLGQCNYGASSIGIWTADGFNRYYGKIRWWVDSAYSADEWAQLGTYYNYLNRFFYDGYEQVVYGKVYSTHSDGFIFYWNVVTSMISSFTLHMVALCIK